MIMLSKCLSIRTAACFKGSLRVRPLRAPYEVDAGLALLQENALVLMPASGRTLLAHLLTVGW